MIGRYLGQKPTLASLLRAFAFGTLFRGGFRGHAPLEIGLLSAMSLGSLELSIFLSVDFKIS